MAADDDNGDGTSLFDIFFDHQNKTQLPQSRLSHQEASIAFYPYPSQHRQNENHNHRKPIKLTT